MPVTWEARDCMDISKKLWKTVSMTLQSQRIVDVCFHDDA